ncbi:hypothetical protein ACU5JM_04730 [Rhodococcus erythropolis]|uniref:hypothetical protein n=1 Tax=Rhodococcus erythropolis TaxID=1833 RepID=UPI00406BD208
MAKQKHRVSVNPEEREPGHGVPLLVHRTASTIVGESVSVLIKRSRHLLDAQLDRGFGSTKFKQLRSSELHHSISSQVVDDLSECQDFD